MLNYHDLELTQRERMKDALRDAELYRRFKGLRRPSTVRRIVALAGNVMVGVGSRLQLEQPANPVLIASNSTKMI